MRIAVTTDGRRVSEEIGKTIKFAIFEVLQGQTRGKLLIDVSACGGHEALTCILKNEGVEVLLCGQITKQQRVDLEQYGIKVVSGLKGNMNTLLRAYIRGQIKGKQ